MLDQKFTSKQKELPKKKKKDIDVQDKLERWELSPTRGSNPQPSDNCWYLHTKSLTLYRLSWEDVSNHDMVHLLDYYVPSRAAVVFVAEIMLISLCEDIFNS